MTRHAAFLRGINLGNRRLRNDELKGHFESIAGFADVDTFLASGNVVFATDPSASVDEGDALERTIEDHLQGVLGYDVDTFVRTFSELDPIAAIDAPGDLVPDASGDGWKLHVIFLKTAPEDGDAEGLAALETDDDRFRLVGREAYWLRRGGLSDSKLMPVDIERALGVRTTTMRTHNTVARLVAKFGDGG